MSKLLIILAALASWPAYAHDTTIHSHLTIQSPDGSMRDAWSDTTISHERGSPVTIIELDRPATGNGCGPYQLRVLTGAKRGCQ